jgi:hypothetical protein
MVSIFSTRSYRRLLLKEKQPRLKAVPGARNGAEIFPGDLFAHFFKPLQ